MKLKELPNEEKPREKAKKYGIENLTNVELLSILFRTGSKQKSIKDFCCDFFNEIGGLEGLKKVRYSSIIKISGMGEAKALTLLAAIELGKRLSGKEKKEKIKIKSTQDVFQNYEKFFENELQEKFCVLFLNNRNEVITEKIIFLGTANYSIVHPRDVFYESILNNAIKIICIHNHPTGDVTPSKEDIKITNQLKEAGQILGIPLLDHVIIGNQSYYSFLERGQL